MTDDMHVPEDQQRTMIERACEEQGWQIESWTEDDDGQKAVIGQFVPNEDDEQQGIYVDEGAGELTASVVGAPRFNNVRVAFYLQQEGSDPMEVKELALIDGA